jgi:hypothetical protein
MDEEQIKNLLNSITTEPGPRFYGRMDRAPWQPRRRATPGWKKPFLLASASLLIIILLFATVPPLQGMAREWMRFFLFTDALELAGGDENYRQFDMSVEQASQAAGFKVLEPAWVPEGFVLQGADYDALRNAVILNYVQPGGLLRITEAKDQNVREIGSVGSQARVLPAELTFRGQQLEAEYVTGAWRLPPFDQVLKEGQPDVSGTLEAYWDPEANIQMLRWESRGILYEIIHGDEDVENLTLEVILQIAQGMQ